MAFQENGTIDSGVTCITLALPFVVDVGTGAVLITVLWATVYET